MAKCFHCHKTAAPGYMFCGMHLKALQRIDTTPPAPTTEPTAKPRNDWKQAIDDELVTIESTADSYPSAKDALKALIDWHVSVALDPRVSSDAQALIDQGRTAITGLTVHEIAVLHRSTLMGPHQQRASAIALAKAVERALAEKNGLAVQGEK